MPYDAGEIEMLPPRHAAVTLPAYTLVDGRACKRQTPNAGHVAMHVAHLTPDPRSLSVAFGAPDERGTPAGAAPAAGRGRGRDRHSTDVTGRAGLSGGLPTVHSSAQLHWDASTEDFKIKW